MRRAAELKKGVEEVARVCLDLGEMLRDALGLGRTEIVEAAAMHEAMVVESLVRSYPLTPNALTG